jgi:hypothetical protein
VVAIIFPHVITLGAWDLSDQDIVDYFDSDASTSNPLDTLSKYDKNCGGIVFILLSGE